MPLGGALRGHGVQHRRMDVDLVRPPLGDHFLAVNDRLDAEPLFIRRAAAEAAVAALRSAARAGYVVRGLEAAEKRLARMLSGTEINAIYTTMFARTRNTAAPTARMRSGSPSRTGRM